MRVAVISLRRTPERLIAFKRRNGPALKNCDVQIVEGVDGHAVLPSLKLSRRLSPSARKNWSPGAIGAAFSHFYCWRLCEQTGKPFVVLEDDVVLAQRWQSVLTRLLKEHAYSPELVLMGWNLDSVLRAEFLTGLEFVSLFEPAYLDEDKTRTALEYSNQQTTLCRLRHCYGLPGYWLTPSMAKRLLQTVNCLASELIILGRGIPKHKSLTLDAQLNLHYYAMKATVTIPPLVLALNDQDRSLTRHLKEFGQ